MKKPFLIFTGLMISLSTSLQADDTDLYTGGEEARKAIAPKMLIVIDTSGSMDFWFNDQKVPFTKGEDYIEPYEKSPEYTRSKNANGRIGGEDFIYYTVPNNEANIFDNAWGKSPKDIVTLVDTKGGAAIELPKLDQTNRFHPDLLNCGAAEKALSENGFFTGYLRNYVYEGKNTGNWEALPESNGESRINAVDCYEDIFQRNQVNKGLDGKNYKYKTSSGAFKKSAIGYPVDGRRKLHSKRRARASSSFGTGQMITIYSASYLRWYYSEPRDIGIDNGLTRMVSARRVIRRIIQSTPSVNFGIMRFNRNADGAELINKLPNKQMIDSFSNNHLNWVKERGVLLDTFINTEEEDKENGTSTPVYVYFNDTAARRKFNFDNRLIAPGGTTPLTESLYEAYLYLKGESPLNPSKLNSVINTAGYYISGSYIDHLKKTIERPYPSPYYAQCDDSINTVLITDGDPSRGSDRAADSSIIKNLNNTGTTLTTEQEQYVQKSHSSGSSYLPLVAHLISTTDFNTKDKDGKDEDLNGNQSSKVFTISYADSVGAEAIELLKVTGALGKGGYFTATDEAKLSAALQAATLNTTEVTGSFTAPSVGTGFDRTRTNKNLYYTQFVPSSGPRWVGNMKKYRVEEINKLDTNGNPIIEDGKNVMIEDVVGHDGAGNKVPAIDDDGGLKTTIFSYWSTAIDAKVTDGGVQAAVAKKTDRSVYYDYEDSSGKLVLSSYKKDTVNSLQTTLGAGKFVSLFGAADTNEAEELAKWVIGEEKKGTQTITRGDIFGDPMHSQPAVLNYGTSTDTKKDVRVIVGTNHGVIHLFKDEYPDDVAPSGKDPVTESWAYMPSELFKNVKALQTNKNGADKVYGVDTAPAIWARDYDNDGYINNSASPKETVYAYFGMRRGGRNIYALDLSIPDTPKLLWKIKGGEGDFEELGYTWSQPQVKQMKIYHSTKGTEIKTVLIFGGGYAESKDSKQPVSSADSFGQGVYIVDAETGSLIWKATPKAVESSDPTSHTKLDSPGATKDFVGIDSVPSQVSALDTDLNGLVDRLYFADTGGNIWRADMPDVDQSKWSVFRFAKLSEAADDADPAVSTDNDIRFYYRPSVARAYIDRTISLDPDNDTATDNNINIRQKQPYEAIVIGSGNRSNPLSNDTENSLFVLRDYKIVTQSFKTNPPKTITLADLHLNKKLAEDGVGGFDGDTDKESRENLQTAFDNVAKKEGWYYKLESGEKSLASPRVVGGIAIFTSFLPTNTKGSKSKTVECGAGKGEGRVYALSLDYGYKIWNNTYRKTGTSVPGSGQLIMTDNGIKIAGLGKDPEDGTNLLTIKTATVKQKDGKNVLDTKKLGLKTMRKYMYTKEK